jgi:hypothetical protein
MTNLSSFGKNAFGVKNLFKGFEDDVRQEQKEMFFHKKSWKDESDYFNFIKFLFSNPQKA